MAMADSKPLVSVCIANYNGNDVISSCIESVLAQDCEFKVEIIMHDDASTDSSCEWVMNHYPQVKVIKSEVNVGFCISNNRMVASADGDYILLLNNDAELFIDALSTLYNHATSDLSNCILGLPQYEAYSGKLIDRGSLFDPFLNPIPNLDTMRTDVGMVIGACFWIPRKIWHELGGFPEWFISMAEDMYLCALARLYGYRVSVFSESGFKHHIGYSFGGGKVTAKNKLKTSYKRRLLSEKNKTAVMIMTYPKVAIWLLFPIHLTLLLIEATVISLFKHDLRSWHAIYWPCIKQLWAIKAVLIKKRRELQLLKQVSTYGYFSTFIWMPYKLTMLLRHGIPELK